LNFFHEDVIQVSGLEGKEKGGTVPGSVQVNQGRLTESSFHRTENLMHSVDDMKIVTSHPDTDSPVMIPGEGLFKSKTAGSDLNQLTHGETKLLPANSNCDKPNRDSKITFASQKVEASTPTSSVPPKDHSKLSSWLPPQLCAIYMKKGISGLYPWQVSFLLIFFFSEMSHTYSSKGVNIKLQPYQALFSTQTNHCPLLCSYSY
jgi:DNA polymerase theta